ncbi:hypothetical protein HI201_RS25955, partial [Escherichia coli]
DLPGTDRQHCGGSEQHRHCGMIKKPPATGMDAGGGDTYGEKIKERYFRTLVFNENSSYCQQ